MNQKGYYLLLTATAVVSTVFALLADSGAMLLSFLQFPFSLIGDGLRFLSLSSSTGNILAWLLLLLLCSLPVVIWLMLRRRRKAVKADALLLVLTPVLAVVLYNMVNPYGSFLSQLMSAELHKAQYGGVVYVMLVGWLVLRIVSSITAADEPQLYEQLGHFLKLLGVLFVISAFGGSLGALLGSIETVRAANQNSGSLTVTYVFLTLQCLVNALPALLNTAAVVMALELLEAFAAESEDTAAYAHRLGHWCATTLTATTIAAVSFHILQMLCMNALRTVDIQISLPIGSIAFLLVCLAAARIIAENKALKDDNDLFI